MNNRTSSLKTVTSKNLIPVCIFQILERHSDYDHKLTQQAIIDYLKSEYSIESVERKAVSRSIERLRDELEIDISSDRGGSWLDSRLFEDSELQLLIDIVFSSEFIPSRFSADLVEKLSCLGNEFFKEKIKYAILSDRMPRSDNKSC